MISINFPKMQNQHCVLAKDADAIRQGLYILLSTRVGEFWCDPAFGCNVRNRLFDANDVLTETLMIEDIYIAIKTFAPYVEVKRDDIQIQGREIGKRTVRIRGVSLLDYTTNIYTIEIMK